MNCVIKTILGSFLLLSASNLLLATLSTAQPYDDYNDRYYGDRYDEDYRDRARDERRDIEREQQRLEDARDRLDRERERLEDEKEQMHSKAPAPVAEHCPSGFSPSEQKCSPEERRRGCKDMRLPGGLGCVHR